MQNIEEIAERIRKAFDARTSARDQVLAQTRTLIRLSAHTIRAIHREDRTQAVENLELAKSLLDSIQSFCTSYPDLYFAGYTQDAFKEYAEATLFYTLVVDGTLPDPQDLGIENSTYLQGLAEATGEMRRRCLDSLRHGDSQEAERMLGYMDDIYGVLITMDYPDAITGGLRRLTDIARSLTERTRGDLTISQRQEQLQQSLRRLEEQL